VLVEAHGSRAVGAVRDSIIRDFDGAVATVWSGRLQRCSCRAFFYGAATAVEVPFIQLTMKYGRCGGGRESGP
jgi:hypothetical protein